jgi:hypothetical protein
VEPNRKERIILPRARQNMWRVKWAMASTMPQLWVNKFDAAVKMRHAGIVNHLPAGGEVITISIVLVNA